MEDGDVLEDGLCDLADMAGEGGGTEGILVGVCLMKNSQKFSLFNIMTSPFLDSVVRHN